MGKYVEKKAWQDYLELYNNRPEAFTQSETIRIVVDEDTVNSYAEKTGKALGVVYSSPWNIMVVDLVESGGKVFSYERLLPATKAPAVVIIAQCGDKYILLKQFRHAIRQEQLGFPRGFGEPGLSAKENAIKEIEEEIGAKITSEDVTVLGQVTGDSGMIGNLVNLCHCKIKNYEVKSGYEGIVGTDMYTKEEIDDLIRTGRITDGFTLSAWAMLKANS